MSDDQKMPHLRKLRAQLAAGTMSRREFVRFATLIGIAVPSAYAMARLHFLPRARAADMPEGGTLRVGTRVKDLKTPHTYSWGAYDSNISRQVCEYLTLTDEHNVTHPYLLESWYGQSRPQDLDAEGAQGREVAQRAGLHGRRRRLEPQAASPTRGRLLVHRPGEGLPAEGRDRRRRQDRPPMLWDANAIEKVDDLTVRLNCKEPQVAGARAPLPLSGGDAVPRATRASSSRVRRAPARSSWSPSRPASRRRCERAQGYWGEAAHLDEIEQRRHRRRSRGRHRGARVEADPRPALRRSRAVRRAEGDAASRSSTRPERPRRRCSACTRDKPFDDPRVRKAMKTAPLNKQAILEVALRGIGIDGDHTTLSPAQPDYAADRRRSTATSPARRSCSPRPAIRTASRPR